MLDKLFVFDLKSTTEASLLAVALLTLLLPTRQIRPCKIRTVNICTIARFFLLMAVELLSFHPS
uniref:Uncharacterized protein n=1 Tax=Brassica oleracea var. oleracea TaxID=109376 RepID=A0A0D3A0Q5_BRAOL